jgi:UDP-glucose 4-epimerase
MVIPRFVTQAIKNEPLTVYGDGSQTRTFTYVKDVVWALMQLIEHDAAFGEVFNIGGIEEISILDLARKIVTATNSSSEIQMIPYDQAFGKDFEDMQRRVPSIEKLQNLIGFDPKTPLDAILAKVIHHIAKRTNGI